MAHNLASINNRSAMFCVGGIQDAWHRLGQRVEACITWKEAMRQAELQWQVRKDQLFDRDGKEVEAYATFRMDDNRPIFLGSVGAGYTVIQNDEAFDFVDYVLAGSDGAHYETAGALGNGEKVWCLARIPQEIRIAGTDDVSLPYILFATSHDGSMAATAMLTSTRVVCQNTLNMALGGGDPFIRVRHTRDAARRLDDGRRFMAEQVRKVSEFEQTLNELAQRRITRESFSSVMDKLFPVEKGEASSTRRDNQLAEIANLYASNDRNAIPQVAGTAYNLLNSITEWTDHVRSVRGGEKSQSGIARTRAENATFGSGARLKEKAVEVILEQTTDAPRHSLSQPVSIVRPSLEPSNSAKPTFTLEAEPEDMFGIDLNGSQSLIDQILAASNN